MGWRVKAEDKCFTAEGRSLRSCAELKTNLISNSGQLLGESPLTPTLSHEYAGEGAETGMLPLPPRATKGPRVALGEGWGEG